jgi:hypothetical protein
MRNLRTFDRSGARVTEGSSSKAYWIRFCHCDCTYDLYTQKRCPDAAVVAAAVVNVIRRRAANQFRKSGMLFVSQPSIARNAEMMRAPVEQRFIHQFAER